MSLDPISRSPASPRRLESHLRRLQCAPLSTELGLRILQILLRSSESCGFRHCELARDERQRVLSSHVQPQHVFRRFARLRNLAHDLILLSLDDGTVDEHCGRHPPSSSPTFVRMWHDERLCGQPSPHYEATRRIRARGAPRAPPTPSTVCVFLLDEVAPCFIVFEGVEAFRPCGFSSGARCGSNTCARG